MLGFVRNIKRNAFTLTELLIALGVIGILTAIVMPIVFNLAPDQNALMAKRAFYTTETIISDLLNDNCYPKIPSRSGLDDGLGYLKCKKWGGEENTGSLGNENSAEKLITLFSDRLDIKGAVTNQNGKYTFQTKDGMMWTFSHLNFVPNNPDSYVLLTVDVNGAKEPNCGQSSTSGQCINKNTKNSFDRFTMRIFARGRIQLVDCWAILAAKIDKKIVGKEDAICNETNDSGTEKEECNEAPSGPDDYCCNDSRWKNSNICNSCVSTPSNPDDYCCTEESGSSWIGTEACDACTYSTPSGPEDECCKEGHKWHGTSACDICANPYSKECCLSKTSSIDYGDKCCEHDEVRTSVAACRNERILVTTKFYVSSTKPKDSDTWGKTKITSQSTVSSTLPFNFEVKYIRGCPGSGVGCGSYDQGMTCMINIGQTSCTASETFVQGTFPYKFELTKQDKERGGFTGFKAFYNIPSNYSNNYSIQFKFPGNLDMY